MKTNVVWRLILKDWRLQRHVMILSIAAGVIALAILRVGGQTPTVIGATFFWFCTRICKIAHSTRLYEKQGIRS